MNKPGFDQQTDRNQPGHCKAADGFLMPVFKEAWRRAAAAAEYFFIASGPAESRPPDATPARASEHTLPKVLRRPSHAIKRHARQRSANCARQPG
jgi:hypothetical protein